MGISDWQIVWDMRNCCFMSEMHEILFPISVLGVGLSWSWINLIYRNGIIGAHHSNTLQLKSVDNIPIIAKGHILRAGQLQIGFRVLCLLHGVKVYGWGAVQLRTFVTSELDGSQRSVLWTLLFMLEVLGRITHCVEAGLATEQVKKISSCVI